MTQPPLRDPRERGRPAATRRAPRLGTDEYLAPYITRLGRFRKLDPRKARKLPSFTKAVGVLAWGVFVEETFRRARRAERDGAVLSD